LGDASPKIQIVLAASIIIFKRLIRQFNLSFRQLTYFLLQTQGVLP
jgi:hypothetical protein